MPRRISLEWPNAAPFRDRPGEPIRILAVSDQLDAGLVDRRNRDLLGRVDLVIGCGDLPAHDLGFIADGVDAPLVYVRGNHDGGERWATEAAEIPEPLASAGCSYLPGLEIVGLGWPGQKGRTAARSEAGAWIQALRLAAPRLGRSEPLLVISHVPPRGAGDIPTDAYHCGFAGYRWLLDRLAPPLWLHGHTPLAAVSEWQTRQAGTNLVNVTGAVLVELCPPRAAARDAGASGVDPVDGENAQGG